MLVGALAATAFAGAFAIQGNYEWAGSATVQDNWEWADSSTAQDNWEWAMPSMDDSGAAAGSLASLDG